MIYDGDLTATDRPVGISILPVDFPAKKIALTDKNGEIGRLQPVRSWRAVPRVQGRTPHPPLCNPRVKQGWPAQYEVFPDSSRRIFLHALRRMGIRQEGLPRLGHE